MPVENIMFWSCLPHVLTHILTSNRQLMCGRGDNRQRKCEGTSDSLLLMSYDITAAVWGSVCVNVCATSCMCHVMCRYSWPILFKAKAEGLQISREDDRPRTQCVRLAAVHRGLRISVWSMPTFSLAPSRLSSPANPTQMFGSLITWEDCDELGFGVFVFSAFCLDGEVVLIQSIFEWESHQWSFCS